MHDHDILALQQYVVEQAKSLGSNSSGKTNQSYYLPFVNRRSCPLGCYKVSDSVTEEGDWDLPSDDKEQLRVEYDSDEFADDEGMSNVDDEDSSSQEYLHDDNAPFLQSEFRSSSRLKKYTTGECNCNPK